jgi:hypothetical protein
MHVCMYLYFYYGCICILNYVCIYVFMYIYIYIYIYIYKGLVNSPEDLLDDVLCLLKALYSDIDSNPDPDSDPDTAFNIFCFLGKNFQKNEKNNNFFLKKFSMNLPFHIMGHSMGGGLAIVLGHMLTNIKSEYIDNHDSVGINDSGDNNKKGSNNENNNNNNNDNNNNDNDNGNDNDNDKTENTSDIANDNNNANSYNNKNINHDDKNMYKISLYFKGCILLCPTISVKKPADFIVNILDYLVVPFFGHFSIPEILNRNLSNPHLVWSNDDYIRYINNDG